MSENTFSISNNSPGVTVTSDQGKLVITDNSSLSVTGKETKVIKVTTTSEVKVVDAARQGINPQFDKTTDTTGITSVVGLRGFAKVDLSWVETLISTNHSHTEVWRSQTDDVLGATPVGISKTQTYTDTIEPHLNYYYWFKPVNHFKLGSINEVSYAVGSSTDKNALQTFLEFTQLRDELTTRQLDLQETLANSFSNNLTEAVETSNAALILYTDQQIEAINPYHTWVIYADDPSAPAFIDKGISLSPDGKDYVGIRTGNRKLLPILSEDITTNADLTGFNFSFIVGPQGEDGLNIETKLVSNNGYFFKNNTGPVKTITAQVFLNGVLSTVPETYDYKWTTGGQQVYVSSAGDFISTSPSGATYPANPKATNGLNFQSIKLDFSDVAEGDILNLTCEVARI
jgi:hypothetical protein